MIAFIISSIALGLMGLLIYVYFMRKGQFNDPEDVKYQIFRDEENPHK